MSRIATEAWVLRRATSADCGPAEVRRETFWTPEATERDVLVEPLFGCWEGNMAHALRRDPLDLPAYRGEESVVLGNAGVVRVLRPGAAVSGLAEGDVCMLYGDAFNDEYGYPTKILGFDAPGTMGLLAKRAVVPMQCLLPIPAGSTLGLREWAAFSVRFITAWDNWRVALGCFRVQMPEVEPGRMHVWAWGGGVALAELMLARNVGCRATLITSSPERMDLIRSLGIDVVDRRELTGLSFDEHKYENDAEYRRRYGAAMKAFLRVVDERTDGRRVSIFIDNIGGPVFRATLSALSRQGVIATSGWKHGMKLSILRARECIERHTHVNTHGSRTSEAMLAMAAAGDRWLPPLAEDPVYSWDDVPRLAADYEGGRITSYYPIYAVNSP